ncbi:MAG: hypoxanthine phosphoribosyltransferase [Acidobacteria bacterium 13_1_40CM_2_68_5]|nr:MAG: hypoxanthine phosphoribosyltransferase [Acidobacteria bacterium 13_1_40CM_2_68_5]OLE66872.1 MAG: hypoxanthine phosphoribosyltransferase [Acidobacteria bacterium 13_1_20CM_2_68_7]
MKLSRDVLRSESEIAERVRQLGKEITDTYAGQEISVLGVLKGAFIFLADLTRQIRLPMDLGFVESVASRRSDSLTEIIFATSLRFSSSFRIEGTHLLLVEDILDTGVTLAYLCEQIQLYQPRSLRVCSLLDKPHRRKVDFSPDFVGFQVPDRHVVGYGLDYQGKYRNLPFLTYVE